MNSKELIHYLKDMHHDGVAFHDDHKHGRNEAIDDVLEFLGEPRLTKPENSG